MGELPLQCSFPLTKLVCCYPYVPPEVVIPAIDALYHPDLHSELFQSSDSVCDWLSAVFSAVSAENMPFMTYFSCNEFIVCNLAHRSTIRLHGLDISANLILGVCWKILISCPLPWIILYGSITRRIIT